MNKLQLVSNVFSANTLGAGSLLPYNKPAVVFDFLDPSNSWVVPVESGIYQYQPGIPEIKNGGLTSDSNIIDGRQWLATPFNTATDTLTLVPSGSSTPETRAEYLSRLLLLARQANAYNTQSGEFRPVSMCVNEPGDAGDRYSRVYDIQYAITGDMFADPATNLQLTLTIVRYQFWTPVPLGTNPKVYTFQARGLTLDDFLVPSELALFPDDIGSYDIAAGGGFSIDTEGYTPGIGYGDTVIDFLTGVGVSGAVRVGNTGSPIAPVVSGNSYTLTFWVRSESASYDAINIQVRVNRSSDGTVLLTSANFTVTVAEGWVKKSFTFTATDSSGVYFFFAKNTSATNVSMDIYGVSVKAAANPLSLTDFGNANPLLQNWLEDTVENIWTREDPANLRLNYIDIPAADVPGDAPALMSVVINREGANVGNSLENMYIARRLDCLSDEALYTATFMAEMSTLSSPVGITSTYVVDASRGINSSPGANPTGVYTMQFAIPGAGAVTSAVVAEWLLTSFAQGGKVAVFARGDLTAGVIADIPFFVRIITPDVAGTSELSVETLPRAMASPAGTAVGITYMGALDFTTIKNALRTVDGLGVGAINARLQLVFGGRTGGAAATYRLTDIILMPYDDNMFTVIATPLYNSPQDNYLMIDNTGYLNQNTDGVAVLYDEIVTTPSYRVRETQGQFLTMEPNRNNRFYFLFGNDQYSPVIDSGGTTVSELITRINIIPQWRRLRSV